ncbi:MAG: hypothetical protein ACLR6S_16550 [Lacrimispora saccharolytica]
MSAKKWVTIITFFCTMFAVILLPIFDYYKCNIGYDISLAIFGSALLGFIMSLVEYFTERRKAMEQFWIEAEQVLAQFRKAKYIKFDEPEDLVISCIAENYKNRWIQNNPTLAKLSEMEESHQQQDKFMKWIDEYEVHSFSEDDDIDAILEKIYTNRINSYENLVKSIIDNYTELSQISLFDLDNAYGNLNFIFANKSIRFKAYNNIYDKMRTVRNKIVMETFHFNLWKESKGNFVVCMNKAIEISKTLFSQKKINQNGIESIYIYQEQFDDIAESLEDFRSKIYLGAKKEQIKRIPVSGSLINFQNYK